MEVKILLNVLTFCVPGDIWKNTTINYHETYYINATQNKETHEVYMHVFTFTS